jgi:phage gp16-like protein
MKRALVAKIHIAKKQLGLDDDVYRSVLSHVTNKTSCSSMTVPELEKVLTHFKNKGFKAKKTASNKKLSPQSGTAKHAEIDKIRAIWITMAQHGFIQDGSETALCTYAKRMTSKSNQGAGVESVAWLNSTQAYVVLESLKKWHRRLMAKALIAKDLCHLNGHRQSWPTDQAPYAYVAAAYQEQCA